MAKSQNKVTPIREDVAPQPTKRIRSARLPSREDRKRMSDLGPGNIEAAREEFERAADQLMLEDERKRAIYVGEIEEWCKGMGEDICAFTDPEHPDPPTIAPAEMIDERNLLVVKIMAVPVEFYPSNQLGLEQLAFVGAECLFWLQPGESSYRPRPFLEEADDRVAKHLTVKLPVKGGSSKRFTTHCPGGENIIAVLKRKAQSFWQERFEAEEARKRELARQQRERREAFERELVKFREGETGTVFEIFDREEGLAVLPVRDFYLKVKIERQEKGPVVKVVAALGGNYREIVKSGIFIPMRWVLSPHIDWNRIHPDRRELARQMHADLRQGWAAARHRTQNKEEKK